MTVAKFDRISALRPGKLVLVMAAVKASVAGAGLALAALASIDLAIAVVLNDALQAWHVDDLISRFAGVGAIIGAVWQVVKIVLAR